VPVYLLDPQAEREHSTLGNKTLDPDLVNFSQKCKDNRISFFNEAFQSNLVKSVPLELVFFTNINKTAFHSIDLKPKMKFPKE
jgi:hypothetical protein